MNICEDRDALLACANLFGWLSRKGGLGLDVHKFIDQANEKVTSALAKAANSVDLLKFAQLHAMATFPISDPGNHDAHALQRLAREQIQALWPLGGSG